MRVSVERDALHAEFAADMFEKARMLRQLAAAAGRRRTCTQAYLGFRVTLNPYDQQRRCRCGYAQQVQMPSSRLAVHAHETGPETQAVPRTDSEPKER